MSKSKDDDQACEAFCASMFDHCGDMYQGPLSTDSSPQMTEAEKEAWAERAQNFLYGSPNRAARVRPKYPQSSSGLGGTTLFSSFL